MTLSPATDKIQFLMQSLENAETCSCNMQEPSRVCAVQARQRNSNTTHMHLLYMSGCMLVCTHQDKTDAVACCDSLSINTNVAVVAKTVFDLFRGARPCQASQEPVWLPKVLSISAC